MTDYLIDTSAFVRLERDPGLREAWAEHIEAARIGICAVTELECLYSARSILDRRRKVTLMRLAYVEAMMPDRVYTRARVVQEELTMVGQHRSAGAADLLVAATAELNGMTLLHYDRDFETIAAITEQPVQWLARPGSIP